MGSRMRRPTASWQHTAAWDDSDGVRAFADACDVVTWEFENVPVDTARAIPADKIFPGPLALETAQDRLTEKEFLTGIGLTTGPGTRRAPGDQPSRTLRNGFSNRAGSDCSPGSRNSCRPISMRT